MPESPLPITRPSRPAGPVFLAIIIAAVVLLLAVPAIRPFLPVDETRYLSVAWEMWLSGEPFHLTMNGAPYSHKPPLLFWLINLIWSFTGPSDYAARLVGPLSAIAVIGLTGLLARRIAPGERGLPLVAMAVLAGTTGFLLYGGATMFDALLTIWVLFGIGAIWRVGQGQRGAGPWLILGLAFGLGVLTKGPVIFLHLMPVLLTVRFWGAAPPSLRDVARGFALALGIGLVLVAIWLVPLVLGADSSFLRELLWDQSADRMAGNMGHGRPVWYLAVVLPALIFPFGWSFAIWRGIPAAARADGAGRMLAIWAVSAFVLFSLVGGKQLHYLLPELPAFAILAGRALPAGQRSILVAFVLPVIFALVALVASFGLVPVNGMEGALGPLWVFLLGTLAFFALAVAAFRLPLPTGHAIAGIGTALVATLILLASGIGDRLDPTPMGERLKAAEAGGLAIWKGDYQAEFNFAGRLTAPVAVFTDPAPLASWLAAHPDGTVIAPVLAPPADVEPASVLPFEDRLWGFWPASTLTSPGSAPAG